MLRAVLPSVVLALMGTFVYAGQLEPTDPPAPTMKSLDEIPPTWSRRLDSTDGFTTPPYEGCNSTRFKCVMYTGTPLPVPRGILDLETGLVWERAPSSDVETWFEAIESCLELTDGNRKGWRLPKVEELLSLIDPTQTSPALPPGHPFLNVSPDERYLTATTSQYSTAAAKVVDMTDGRDTLVGKDSLLWYYWCVRGGEPNTFTSQPN